jgi:hypothetical protein
MSAYNNRLMTQGEALAHEQIYHEQLVHDSETCAADRGQPCEMCLFANTQEARLSTTRKAHISELRCNLIAEIDRMQGEVNRLDAEMDQLEDANG